MPAKVDQHSPSEFIKAPLKYLADDKELAVYIASEGGGDSTIHQGNYIMQTVAIHNGRVRAEGFNLDREGFTMTSQLPRESTNRSKECF